MSKLILVRHGQTPYNEAGLWTGLTDIGLSEIGRQQAWEAGKLLGNVAIHAAYVSLLRRTACTLGELLLARGLDSLEGVHIEAHAALNERDYGVFTGKSKQEVKQQLQRKYGEVAGEEEFLLIRRAWNHPIEGGQSLKDKHDQIVPFHQQIVIPRLEADQNVLVVSSNNPLRAYVKEIEGIPSDEVAGIELGTAEVRVYDFDTRLNMVERIVHKIGDVH